ncbi:peptidoglycan-binding protein [Rhodobacteraceae bacterium M382]|nr:peptidoglycan-binding protein [Rhodobacteraceae bacterium M382]
MALDIRLLQRRLKELKCYAGRIDGIWGRNTEKAVCTFQKNAGLDPDGIVGPKTLAALNIQRPDLDSSVATAAELVKISYTVKKQGVEAVNKTLKQDHGVWITSQCPVKGVEAYLLNNRCLLVPGSNSFWDYAKFNFRLLNLGMPRLGFGSRNKTKGFGRGTAPPDKNGIIWHQGFLTHANHISKWIGNNPEHWPRLVVGHSLGAASAQILSTIWTAPSIGFAAPRILKSKAPSTYRNLSLSICRTDDLVCRFPRGFERLGASRTLIHKSPRKGLNHNMAAYIDAMHNRISGLGIPDHWAP